MSSRAWSGVLAFLLLGLGASMAATWVHYQLVASADYISFCDVNASFSCAQAYQSEYGRLIGVPVAVLGVAYFLGLTLLATLGRRLEALAGYLFVATGLGLVVVIYLAWATLFVIGTFCLLCVATYVAVIGTFFVAGAAMPFPLSGLSSRLSRDLPRLRSTPAALVALLLVLATTVAGAVLFPADAAAPQDAAATPGASPAPPRSIGEPLNDEQKAQVRSAIDASPRSIVPADAAGARVVVVKFNDYQCPPCRQTYEIYQPVKAKWEAAAPGQVKFITRDFPLEPECNPSAPGGSHTAACEAAVAVRLARERGKGDEMEAWLFARQASLAPDLIREGVAEVAGVSDYEARYAETLASVRNDTALGASLGVNSTPTFFINGIKISAVQPPVLDYVIEYELARASAARQ